MTVNLRSSAANRFLELRGEPAGSQIRPAKLADAVAGHLETLILEGALRAGDRLLPERELAQKLNVSRPSLREALELMEGRGFLVSGRGGTRISPVLGQGFSDPLFALVESQPEATYEYLEFRSVVEGAAAYYAALRATDLDREMVDRHFAAIEAAHQGSEPGGEADADAAFHLSIYEASHNLMMLHVMGSLSEVLHRAVFYNREKLYQFKGVRVMLLDQHRAIRDAILSGDADAARTAAETHVKFTRQAMREIDLADRRLEISLRSIVDSDVPPMPAPEERPAASFAGLTDLGPEVPGEAEIPLAGLLKSHPETAFDYLEFRFITAGMAAHMAATRATDEDRARITRVFERMVPALEKADPSDECAADREFHLAINAATHNSVISHVMRSIFVLLHQDAFYDRARFHTREGVRELLFRQHKALYQAIMARDAEQAKRTAEKHALYIRDSLVESRISEHRTLLALRRGGRGELVQIGDAEG